MELDLRLSEKSVRGRRFVEVPDFTRGGWHTAEPLGIATVDMSKFDFRNVDTKTEQMDV